MTDKQYRESIYKRALEKFGTQAQMIAALEEISELSVEIAKKLNGKRDGLGSLIDELADTRIVVEQLEMMFCIEERVQLRMRSKIEKLETYL